MPLELALSQLQLWSRRATSCSPISNSGVQLFSVSASSSSSSSSSLSLYCGPAQCPHFACSPLFSLHIVLLVHYLSSALLSAIIPHCYGHYIVLCPIVSEYLFQFDPRSWIQNKFVFLSQEGVMVVVLHTFGPNVKGKAYCTLLFGKIQVQKDFVSLSILYL